MKNRSAFTLLACATILVGGVYAVAQNSTTTSNSQTSSGNATSSSSGRATASSGGSQGGSFGGGQSGSGVGSGSGGSGQMTVNGPVWVVTWAPTSRTEKASFVRQIEEKHSKWIQENYHLRGVMMEGYFENGDGRMALVYGLEENAHWIAKESPLTKGGVAEPNVRKWNVEHSVLSLATQPGRVAPAAGAVRASGGGN